MTDEEFFAQLAVRLRANVDRFNGSLAEFMGALGANPHHALEWHVSGLIAQAAESALAESFLAAYAERRGRGSPIGREEALQYHLRELLVKTNRGCQLQSNADLHSIAECRALAQLVGWLSGKELL